jgi:hypothetical protein
MGQPVAWHYQTADGVDHYVGDAADVPAAQRASARPVDVSGISLNSQAEKDLEASGRHATEQREAEHADATARAASRLPSASWFVVATLFLGATATLLHRLYDKRFSGNERLWRAARATSWLTGLAALLVVARLALPHLGEWKQQLARFSFDALVADEEHNFDAPHHGQHKAESKAAGADTDKR